MARRHYSDEARAAALAALEANAGNVTRTARETGVPRATLQLWAAAPDRAAPPELRQEKRVEAADVYASIRDKASALLDKALDLISPEALAADTKLLVAVSTVGGTATDKGQLLAGKPTENVKQKVEVTVRREDRPIRASD